MSKYLTTPIGRLRLFAFLEGVSLLLLIFIAMPMKYFADDPQLVKILGPIHGVLFLLFLFYGIMVGTNQNWKFKDIAFRLIIAGFIPFGTFYIDHKYLRYL